MQRRTLVAVSIATSLVLLLMPGPGSVAQAAPEVMTAATSGGFPFGEPAYDSGWVDISAGESVFLSHGLGGERADYVVDLQGRSSSGDRHTYYGGERFGPWTQKGFHWSSLSPGNITVSVAADETQVEQVRVRIWVVPSAGYDSGWQALPAGGTIALDHHLGGDTDDYLVYLELYSPLEWVNQIGYGRDRYRDSGDVFRSQGVYWYGLTGQSIKLYKGADSEHADSGRVRIWRVGAPDYDSGWVSVSAGSATTLEHDLGGPWNDYLVDLQFKDTDGTRGVNQRSYGRDDYESSTLGLVDNGGYWRSLNSSEITLYRASDDGNADQMRVRIWASGRPKYDSGWQSLGQGEQHPLHHQLGGDQDTYVVDLQFRDTDADGYSGAGVNHWNYGGDTALYDASLHSYGATWLLLTEQGIGVERFGHDRGADEVRVRIWIAPFAEYDSGWIDTGAGDSVPLVHDTGVGAVYLEFYEENQASGHSQLFYGMNRQQLLGMDWEAGAYWGGLDSSRITIYRGANDWTSQRQRVRIWQRPNPAYDSGWVELNPGTGQRLAHNLGLDTDGMVVEMQSMAGGRVNNASYGGDRFSLGPSTYLEGAYWYDLTTTSVCVWREAHDTQSASVRVRIYLEAVLHAYLPVGLRGF